MHPRHRHAPLSACRRCAGANAWCRLRLAHVSALPVGPALRRCCAGTGAISPPGCHHHKHYRHQ
eukprot:3968590-Prorocentrum_lima.AAC.1